MGREELTMRSRRHLLFLFIAALLLISPLDSLLFSSMDGTQEQVRLHYSTDWQIEPSFKYDALCFINVLTGDPFYLKHYEEDYKEFKSLLTKPVKLALNNLKKEIKDKAQSIISAVLCLYFSAVDEVDLDGLLKTIDDYGTMQDNLKKTPYYTPSGWQLFLSIRKDLKTIFHFLKDIQFELYWERHILPRTADKIRSMRQEVLKYNITEEIESHLGKRLVSRRIKVYVLYYSKPHALKITGTRYLTNADWPLVIVLRTAVHELMHPPYDIKEDTELRQALFRLNVDSFLMDKVLDHNPSFGYNTFEGFLEEDCVQALDQIICEKLKIGLDPYRRWKETDDGMHVLAVALYSLMKEYAFDQKGERFRDFLLRMANSDELAPGKIKSLYDRFYRERLPD
jgi:hypothetical protein